jgi:tRNA-splicing ligase RtcB
MNKKDFVRLSDYLWEVPKDFRSDMRAPARVYASDRLLEQALRDDSLKQLVNTATLPGIVKYSLAMPDVHQGYGFPIGGVVATRTSDGVISPGGVGYDINCGVRVLASDLLYEEAVQHLDTLISALYSNCPSGVGKGGSVIAIDKKDFDKVLHEGSKWALEAGYARKEDVTRTEERGQMPAADASKASKRARERGIDQVGTLGAGNHFIEVDLIEEIYDEEAATAMGLVRGNIALQIHCGSRGFGHQVCDDFVRSFQKAVQDYNIQLPDRQLVCVPFHSPEGQAYFAAMSAAANFAFANRQVLTYLARRSFEQVFAGKVRHWDLHQIYDVAHNIAKVERHEVDGKQVEVVVHRKGATRAFGPGQEGLPPEYRDTGQPVLVPGSMGTSSWILAGTNAGMEQTFGSTCHGAGRTMSRKQAKSTIRGTALREELEGRGISVRAGSMAGLAEEAPEAYKDVDDVVQVVHGAGIATKVARLTPLAVMKG